MLIRSCFGMEIRLETARLQVIRFARSCFSTLSACGHVLRWQISTRMGIRIVLQMQLAGFGAQPAMLLFIHCVCGIQDKT